MSRCLEVSTDEILDLLRDGHTRTQIAEHFGVDYEAVKKRIQRGSDERAFEMSAPITPDVSEGIWVLRHECGWNSREIGAKFGYDGGTIRPHLKRLRAKNFHPTPAAVAKWTEFARNHAG